MNQEEQRAAIAEACGWTLNPAKHTAKGLDWLHVPSGNTTYNPPDYLNDLNACHKMEETLTQDQMIDYSRHVGKLVTIHLPASRAAWMDFKLINSTASQRAEAFLRTIGKWKEAKP